MASKNLGAVIQRAISDGAFRRQLQSDPAAALRGFNLTADEVAAIRSGDSSKLMSLGVDQRMSKAFTVGGEFASGAARSTVSDLNAGGTASTLANDSTSTAREGIVGDPTSSSREALTTGNLSGTRAINDNAPFEGNVHGLADPTLSGTRAVHDSEPADLRGAVNDNIAATTANRGGSLAGDMSTGSTRAIHDSEPTDLRAAATTGDLSGTRAIHDSEPADLRGAINESVASGTAGRGGSLTGDMSTSVSRGVHDSAPFGTPGTSAVEDINSPEYAATQDAAGGTASAGGNALAADDNFAVSSRMADAGDASSIRQIHDVAPFEGNVNAAATDGNEFLGGDARLDPGTDSSHGFVPSDSADVQREMLEDHGNALGNAGGDTGDEHSWG